jgi:hypothetical protein
MCIAAMVEHVLTHWTDDDWNDVDAAAERDLPQAMMWEVLYVVGTARELRREIPEG